MAGTKFDECKPRMGLVAPEFVEGVARVLTFGADKYGAYNWAEVRSIVTGKHISI